MSNKCPVCKIRPIKNSGNKTCGHNSCKGILAEETKKRVPRQKAAEPFLRACDELSKRSIKEKICVVCGDFLGVSLREHHFDKDKDPTDTVVLCASCHGVFDSTDSGLSELEIRRDRYYEYNLNLIKSKKEN